ncbi:15933_t:CDS:10, partial [Cetraspora pellucida]
DDPDFHIIDGVETIYEEDLESFENKGVLVSSNNELQEIDDDIASDLNEDAITYFTKELASKVIYHTLTSIEYPETSSEGVAYVYNTEGWEDPLTAFKNVMCPYLGVEVKHEMRTCQGSKLCEFGAHELYNQTHQCVDINSDLMMRITKEISSSNMDNNTFELYLAILETPCKFQKNNQLCEGKAVLHRLSCRDHSESTYFIGCTNWKIGEKYHRFMHISPDINIKLLHSLFDGTYEPNANDIDNGSTNECYTVYSNSSKKKYCRLHTHPPPPPTRTPGYIKQRLQALVKQVNEDLLDVTPTHIVTRNLIKTYFGIDNLCEVHASFNNTNKLRYCVNKIQKEKHPFGQDLLGVVYNFSRNIDNFQDYVQRLNFFSDGHIMIICTSQTQIQKWIKCNYFEIDLSFKRVAGEINEFEFNHIHGNGWCCIISDLDIAQLIGLGETLALIDNSFSWEEHLVHIFKSCQVHYKQKLNEKRFENNIKAKMELLLTAKAEKVELIFDELLTLDNNLVGNTNCAETAHAMSNREGKQLKLMMTILRGQKLDMCNFKRTDIKANFNINTCGYDKSNIARKKLEIKRIKRQSKASSSTKRRNKLSSFQINKKQRTSQVVNLTDDTSQESQKINSSNNELNESGMTIMEKLEYEERMLMIAERKEKLRELRISNVIKERELGIE